MSDTIESVAPAATRTNNNLCTPEWIWRRIVEHLGPIELDPCSNEWSSVPANTRFSGPAHGCVDGLTVSWIACGGLVYVNPPYGRGHLRQWAQKCVAEAVGGVEIVALVPCSPDTAWWQSCLPTVRAIAYLRSRVSFEGGEHGSGSFASALLYWGDRPHLFLHAFGDALADGRFFR